MEKLADIRKQRAAAFDQFKALAEKDVLTPEEVKSYDELKGKVEALDAQAERLKAAQALAAETAQPVAGQDVKAHAAVETDAYASDAVAQARGLGSSKGLILGGVTKMLGAGGGNLYAARQAAKDIYGESHPVTKALVTSTGAAGGFIVPPEVMNEIIELLRPKAVVRSAGPRTLPMPRGTMTLPGQASAASASYGSEVKQIASSQQTLNQIVASFKKLTALVPVSNDMMRYADPAVDAFVRDDLVKIIALREDLAFILGDGTADTPRGFISFANGYVQDQGGTMGNWSTSGNSTAASGGNFITSNETYTLATAASELGGLVNKLDTANVPDTKRVWFMHPRSFNYLFNVQNSLGVYVYRDELSRGTLLTYPVRKSTQIGINYHDASSAQTDCSFVFLVEMDEAMILDSMQLELAVSREGTYVDANSNTISAFQNDQTLIRAIAEHDFQMRHNASIAVAQFVRWAPAIS